MADTINVIAIDPGVTSGFCYGHLIPGERLDFFPTQFVDDVDDLWRRLDDLKPRYIIMEDFAYRQGRQRSGINLFPVQLIGIARFYAVWGNHKCAIQLQSASQAKGYFTDAKLKSFKYHVRGMPHGMDATRHLLQWITFGSGYQFSAGKSLQEFAFMLDRWLENPT